jgi:hypothetical protein
MLRQWNYAILLIAMMLFDLMAKLRVHSLRFNDAKAWRQTLPLSIVVFVTYIIYQRHFSPLSKVPGPFLASFTNLWCLRTVLRQHQHLDSMALHEKYGLLVRIGTNHVYVSLSTV